LPRSLTRPRPATAALAWRPEWPVAVVCALGWSALVIGPGPVSGGHSTHAATGWSVLVAATLMAAAMMLPPTLPAVRHVAFNSMRHRRRRAVAGYVTAYLLVWAAFGVAVPVLGAAAGAVGVGGRPLLCGVVAVAVGWQVTPWKRRAVAGCRRTVPLPPVGWRAEIACARFGLTQAWRCLVACWPLMLLVCLPGHGNLVATAVATMVVTAETRTGATGLRAPMAGVAATAAAVLLNGPPF
jgi:predicted metal-binding membrane protein